MLPHILFQLSESMAQKEAPTQHQHQQYQMSHVQPNYWSPKEQGGWPAD